MLLESYNNQTGHTLYSRAKTRRYALQWDNKLKFLEVCRIKSIKSINFFFLFHFRIVNFLKKEKKDNMTQDIATVKNKKKEEKKKEEEKGKKKKEGN